MKNVIAKIRNRRNSAEEITRSSVIIEALCAHRDKLIMSKDYRKPEIQAQLLILQAEIVALWNSTPVVA